MHLDDHAAVVNHRRQVRVGPARPTTAKTTAFQDVRELPASVTRQQNIHIVGVAGALGRAPQKLESAPFQEHQRNLRLPARRHQLPYHHPPARPVHARRLVCRPESRRDLGSEPTLDVRFTAGDPSGCYPGPQVQLISRILHLLCVKASVRTVIEASRVLGERRIQDPQRLGFERNARRSESDAHSHRQTVTHRPPHSRPVASRKSWVLCA
jgi:hypothetical protein